MVLYILTVSSKTYKFSFGKVFFQEELMTTQLQAGMRVVRNIRSGTKDISEIDGVCVVII